MAATSPLALASVLVVLTGSRARLKGAALAIGFVAGQSAFLLLVFAIGTQSSPDGENHPAVVDSIEIAFGIALLVTAVYVRRHRSELAQVRGPSPRTEAIRSRLANLRPLTALGTGALLGIGGPKRIGVTIVVSAAIAAAGVETGEALGLAVLYVAVATVLVWGPVTRVHERSERTACGHKAPLTFYPSAVLGTVLVLDGIVHLVRNA